MLAATSRGAPEPMGLGLLQPDSVWADSRACCYARTEGSGSRSYFEVKVGADTGTPSEGHLSVRLSLERWLSGTWRALKRVADMPPPQMLICAHHWHALS